jgi:hypothetical protein
MGIFDGLSSNTYIHRGDGSARKVRKFLLVKTTVGGGVRNREFPSYLECLHRAELQHLM